MPITAPDYLRTIPSGVPPGSVVVHNNVKPARRLGSRGFRAWLDDPARVGCAGHLQSTYAGLLAGEQSRWPAYPRTPWHSWRD